MADLDMYGPFDGTPQYEDFWREMMKHVNGTASGVIRGNGNDFSTVGDSTGMQVKVNTGEAWVRGHYGKGTVVKTIPIASNSSGSTRIDRIVLRADFNLNKIIADVVLGTAVAPALTQNSAMWEISLATVSVANGAVTITAGNVTDDRSYTTVFAKYTRAAVQTPIANSAFTDLVFDTTVMKCNDVVLGADMKTLTVKRAGLWMAVGQCGMTPPASGAPFGRVIQITDSAGIVYSESTPAGPENPVNAFVQATAIEFLPANSTFKVRANQFSGVALSSIAGSIKFSLVWVGP